MSLRAPRYKNEFLNTHDITMGEKENLIFIPNQISLVTKAIISYLDAPKTNDGYSFGVLDLESNYYDLQEYKPRCFASETGRTESSIAFNRNCFNLKYLYQEFIPKREEDFIFLSRIYNANLALNPCLQGFQERAKNFETKYMLPRCVHDFLREISICMQEFCVIDEITQNYFRYLPNRMISSRINFSYNFFVGGSGVIYSDLLQFNREYFYHYLYLYLYRLYDLTLNQGIKVRMCIVIPAINYILNPENYKSFYVTEQQAQDRYYKIKTLLLELLSRGKEFNLNFIFLDTSNETKELLEPYCQVVEPGINNLKFGF